MSVLASEVFNQKWLKIYNKCINRYPEMLLEVGLKSTTTCYVDKDNNPDYFVVAVECKQDIENPIVVFPALSLQEFHKKMILFEHVLDRSLEEDETLCTSVEKLINESGRYMAIEDTCRILSALIANMSQVVKTNTFESPEYSHSDMIN